MFGWIPAKAFAEWYEKQNRPMTEPLKQKPLADRLKDAIGFAGNEDTARTMLEAARYIASVDKTLADSMKSIRANMTSFGAGEGASYVDQKRMDVHQIDETIRVTEEMDPTNFDPAMSQAPEDMGEVSDGFHTFNELYEHRHMLFLAMMGNDSIHSWFSLFHDDGTVMEGWFIGGVTLGHQPITYHMPTRSGARYQDRAPKWDGHTSADVIKRIHNWLLA